jgi:His-Xaa-Ser system radical SAM maturase HxsC
MSIISFRSKNHNIKNECLVHVVDVENCYAYSLDINKPSQIEEINAQPFSFVSNKECQFFILPNEIKTNLTPGSLIFVSPKGFARKVFEPKSPDNVLFITGQCNNQCIMCSQPPVHKNDFSFFERLNSLIVHLMPEDTLELGISGGEPTLLGVKLVDTIRNIYKKCPKINLNILSNGRAFANKEYASLFKEFNQELLVIGVPLHSDFHATHDLITGQKGSYNQTLIGLYNLAFFEIAIELRIVVHKQNYERLPQLSSYIFKNLPFVKHVAFMGLETTGFTLKNKELVWIDPIDYIFQLEKAVNEISEWGIETSIYNIPLCLLKPSLYKFSKKSISDWKLSFVEHCQRCLLNKECCGVFSTSKIQSNNIKAFQ